MSRIDPRGVVSALRRAVREGDRGMEDFLADTITDQLEWLAELEPAIGSGDDTDGPCFNDDQPLEFALGRLEGFSCSCSLGEPRCGTHADARLVRQRLAAVAMIRDRLAREIAVEMAAIHNVEWNEADAAEVANIIRKASTTRVLPHEQQS